MICATAPQQSFPNTERIPCTWALRTRPTPLNHALVLVPTAQLPAAWVAGIASRDATCSWPLPCATSKHPRGASPHCPCFRARRAKHCDPRAFPTAFGPSVLPTVIRIAVTRPRRTPSLWHTTRRNTTSGCQHPLTGASHLGRVSWSGQALALPCLRPLPVVILATSVQHQQ